jgi:three-Cys-motif partner protein
VLVEGKRETSDASVLAAWNSSVHPSKGQPQPLTDILIADQDPENVRAAEARLRKLSAPVTSYIGSAEDTVVEVVKALPRNALHFAFLDPYCLRPLPFVVVEQLARVPALDLLIHVSVSDMRRNLGAFVRGSNPHLDSFFPGWRERYDPSRSDDANLRNIVSGWCEAVAAMGKHLNGIERIAIGDRPLYWLVMLSASELAIKFWEKVKKLGPQRPLLE